jgi:hypothetical protein
VQWVDALGRNVAQSAVRESEVLVPLGLRSGLYYLNIMGGLGYYPVTVFVQ